MFQSRGRLYPNLDELVDDGLVSKRQRDGRTNECELADTARDALDERRRWEVGGEDDS